MKNFIAIIILMFSRFLRPYMIGASIIGGLALFLGMYLTPIASKGFNEFEYKYL